VIVRLTGAWRLVANRDPEVHHVPLQAGARRAHRQLTSQDGSARRRQERIAEALQGQRSGRQLQARREGRKESQGGEETEGREEAEGCQVAEESQEAQEGGGVGRNQAQGCQESQVARQSQGRQAQDGQEASQGCCQVAQEGDKSCQAQEGKGYESESLGLLFLTWLRTGTRSSWNCSNVLSSLTVRACVSS